MKQPLLKSKQNEIKAKLKKMGHDPDLIDAKKSVGGKHVKLDTQEDFVESICLLHGLTLQDYRRIVR